MSLKTILINYARQPSTWKGISILLSAAGVAVSPELMTGVSSVVISAIGLWEVFRNERKGE